MSRIKTTKGQRTKLLQRHPGRGFIAYKSDVNTTCEIEFYIDRDGVLRYIQNGAPLVLEFYDDDGCLHCTPPLGLVSNERSKT